MNKISLTCKIITPLFMGGAEQQPELRTQSFNGLFRYWFRLLGGKFEDEKRLFGWGGEKANEGLIKIVVKTQGWSFSSFQPSGAGYNYLGFSLRLTRREGIQNSNNFTIIFHFHLKTTEEDIKKFLCAVWCAFYLGNFGSRSRRGFGSIVVEEIEGDIPAGFKLKFKPEGKIQNWLKEQLNYIKGLNYWYPRKDIPYIFENLEVHLFNKSNDCIRLLDEIGTLYRDLRRKYSLPERIWFGLPIRNIIPQIQGRAGRRASPLIFKIIQIEKNNFVGFILVFKPNSKNHNFKFLPDGASINLKGVNLDKPNWEILDEFINSLKNFNLITKVYP